MAFPAVVQTRTTKDKNGSVSVNYPTGMTTGNLVVFILGWAGDANPVTHPAGNLTFLADEDNASGSAASVSIWYREVTGTEGSSETFDFNSGRDTTAHVIEISGWDDTTAPLAATSTTGGTSTTSPNPPSRSWAWSADTLTLAGFVFSDSETVTNPSGYTTVVSDSRSGSALNHVAEKDVTTSPEDPAAFTCGAARTTSTFTIVIPAPAGGTGVTVTVPASNIGVGATAPTVSTGASVAVPAANVGVAALAPTVSTGVNITVPAVNISVAALPPGIATGAAVAVPAANINVEGLAPSVSAATGVAINVPAANIGVAALPPTIQTGINVEVPAADIAVQALAPTVTATEGVSVNVPAANINIIAFPPTITAASGQAAPRRVGSGYSKDHEQGRERAERDRKTTRETRRQAVERAFKALEPQQVQEVVEAQEPLPVEVQQDIAQAAMIDLGDVEASLDALLVLVNEIWAQRLEEIYEDEAIELLLLAS